MPSRGWAAGPVKSSARFEGTDAQPVFSVPNSPFVAFNLEKLFGSRRDSLQPCVSNAARTPVRLTPLPSAFSLQPSALRFLL